MRCLYRLSFLVIALVCGAAFSGAGRARAGVPAAPGAALDLRWRDLQGREYGPADLAASRATVLVFSSARCPCADGYTERLIALAREFAGRGTRFFLVFSNAAESAEEVERYVAARGFPFAAVRDETGALAHRLGARATPTAALLDGAATLRYLGRIDDNPAPVAVTRSDLREALARVLAGQPVAVARTTAVGCAIRAAGEPAAAPRPPRLLPGIGKIELNATSASPRARQFVDQGLALWYGFNFDEAERSFREAARLDPECALAHWGLTLALGMNYNWDYDPGRGGEARAAIVRALALAGRVTPRERALIEAMAIRHPASPPDTGNGMADRQRLLEAYHDSMRRIYWAYPDDPDIAVLYTASGMDLRPWDLWTRAGEPRPGTLELLLVLEETLRRHPGHIGANHYFIHVTEQSSHPERGLPSAERLAELAPRSGHLIHMPSHLFIRTGDYHRAAESNRRAADADAEYLEQEEVSGGYTGYYLHTLDFRVAALCIEGRSREAVETARELAARTAKHDPSRMARLCGGPSSLIGVWARFGKWDEILAAPPPAESAPMARVVWHFGRGLALVARRDLPGAEKELLALIAATPSAERSLPTPPNPAFTEALRLSFLISRHLLTAKLRLAQGIPDGALAAFRDGIEAEDRMPYLEAPGWRYPVREALGGALLTLGRAAEAEAVFRQDLKHNPHSGRSLFGLARSLEAQGKREEAERASAEFRAAWANADVELEATAL